MSKKVGRCSTKKTASAPAPAKSTGIVSRGKAAPRVALPKESRRGEAAECVHSDDDSVCSGEGRVTRTDSDDESTACAIDGRDGCSQFEFLEEKLKDAIEMTSQKSVAGRAAAFKTLCQALSTKYLVDFTADRRMTIMECIERGLKKGRGAEQEAAAKLAALVCLQLGPISDSDEVYLEQKHTLLTIIADSSAAPSVRAECCLTVGLCTFLADTDVGEISQTMNILEEALAPLEAVLASSDTLKALEALEADARSPDALMQFYSAALSAWTLLITLLPPRQIYELSKRQVRRLTNLLDCSDVDLRIGAGEAIAAIFEGARCFDKDFGFEADQDEDQMDELCCKLRQLATDSRKFRAKKDRKQQRSSFRDVLRTVEEKEAPDLRFKFGQELLEVDSWSRKHQYNSFCHVLGSGMNLHLAKNELVRDIFALGAPLVQDQASLKALQTSKIKRHHMNVAAFKFRSVIRGEARDKRTAVF